MPRKKKIKKKIKKEKKKLYLKNQLYKIPINQTLLKQKKKKLKSKKSKNSLLKKEFIT